MKGRTKGSRYKNAQRKFYIGRVLASISILALLLAVCMWAPLAIATDDDGGLASDESIKQATASEPAADSTETAVVTADEVAESSSAGSTAGEDSETSDDPIENATTGDNGTGGADAVPAEKTDDSSSTSAAGQESAASEAATTSAALANYEDDGAGSDQYGGCDDCGEDEGVTEDYDLDLVCGDGYWDSRADYEQYLLSIDYELTNNGPGTAINVRIVGATATNGVTAEWFSTLTNWEELAANETVYFTIKWLVPPGVGSFVTDIEICAGCGDDGKDDAGGDQYGDDGDDDGAGDDQYGDDGDDDGDDGAGDDQYGDDGDDDGDDGAGDDQNGDDGKDDAGDQYGDDGKNDDAGGSQYGDDAGSNDSNDSGTSDNQGSGLNLSSMPVTGIGFIVTALFGLTMVAAGTLMPMSGRRKR